MQRKFVWLVLTTTMVLLSLPSIQFTASHSTNPSPNLHFHIFGVVVVFPTQGHV